MASIEIRPATLDDAPAINRAHYDALDMFHDFYGIFYALHPRELLPKLNARGLNNPCQVFLVAVMAGEVVGFVRYQMVDAEGNVENEKDIGLAPMGPLVRPKEHLRKVWERFSERDEKMDRCYKEATKGLRHACVLHLMVHPSHQRKGIGGKLLSTVVTTAEEEGLPTFMVSSAEAYRLYKNLGFEDLGTFRIDNAYWASEAIKAEKDTGIYGNEEVAEKYKGVEEVETWMVRWPKATSEAL